MQNPICSIWVLKNKVIKNSNMYYLIMHKNAMLVTYLQSFHFV